MITLLSALGSLLSFRVRSRAALELELVALRHQVTVLRRQRPGQPRLLSADRLLWTWLLPPAPVVQCCQRSGRSTPASLSSRRAYHWAAGPLRCSVASALPP